MAEMSEDLRLAIYGYNPRTGKAFTPEESAAVNAGYNPYAGFTEATFDAEGRNVIVRNPTTGQTMTLGARFTRSSAGAVVPDLPQNWGAFRYNEQGIPVNAQGQPITDADIATYNSLVNASPEAAREFAQGKGFSATGGTGASGTGAGAGGTGTGALVMGTGAGAGTGTGAGGGARPLPGTPEFAAFQARESAYNLLRQQMAAYGLESLVEPLKNLVLEGVSPSEFTIRLRDTAGYKQRFAANQARIQRGLAALSEAEYIALEDQYQDVMRRYGLPQSYYTRGDLGRQEGFEKFISQDVSPVELEDRIQTAYDRVINANPEVSIALRTFYPGITNGDVLAYALDPEKALGDIKRKITAAEIGGAAVQAGLTTNESDAAYLARYGITKEQAQSGYRTISGFLPRAQQLSSIYQRQFEGGPYTQASAEREVFGTPGAAEEERKRQRITSLEQAAFAGQSGLTGGALGRERAGQF